MDQNQGTKFVRDGKEPVQAGVGELDSGDLRADLHAQEAVTPHTRSHFFDRPVGFLQGDGSERGEAGWAFVDYPGEELVLGRCQFGGAGRRRRVAERRRNRRKNLQSNAFNVHVDDPSLRRPAPVIDAAVGNPAEQQLRLGLADAVGDGHPAGQHRGRTVP